MYKLWFCFLPNNISVQVIALAKQMYFVCKCQDLYLRRHPSKIMLYTFVFTWELDCKQIFQLNLPFI